MYNVYPYALQAHKLHDNIHDIELSTLDARTVGEVRKNVCCHLLNMTIL